MSETTAKNAIVVGVDGSAGSDAAIRWAVGEATLRAAPIILVHVVAPLVVAWPVGRIQGNITRGDPRSRPVLWLHGSGPGVTALTNWQDALEQLSGDF